MNLKTIGASCGISTNPEYRRKPLRTPHCFLKQRLVGARTSQLSAGGTHYTGMIGVFVVSCRAGIKIGNLLGVFSEKQGWHFALSTKFSLSPYLNPLSPKHNKERVRKFSPN